MFGQTRFAVPEHQQVPVAKDAVLGRLALRSADPRNGRGVLCVLWAGSNERHHLRRGRLMKGMEAGSPRK